MGCMALGANDGQWQCCDCFARRSSDTEAHEREQSQCTLPDVCANRVQPVLTAARSGSNVTLSYVSQPGHNFTVLYNTTLTGGTWLPLSAAVAGDAAPSNTVNDSTATSAGQARDSTRCKFRFDAKPKAGYPVTLECKNNWLGADMNSRRRSFNLENERDELEKARRFWTQCSSSLAAESIPMTPESISHDHVENGVSNKSFLRKSGS